MAAWEHQDKEGASWEEVWVGSLLQTRPGPPGATRLAERGPDMSGQKCGEQGDLGQLVFGGDLYQWAEIGELLDGGAGVHTQAEETAKQEGGVCRGVEKTKKFDNG